MCFFFFLLFSSTLRTFINTCLKIVLALETIYILEEGGGERDKHPSMNRSIILYTNIYPLTTTKHSSSSSSSPLTLKVVHHFSRWKITRFMTLQREGSSFSTMNLTWSQSYKIYQVLKTTNFVINEMTV